MLSVRRKVIAVTIIVIIAAVAFWWFRGDDDHIDRVRELLEKRDFRQASVLLSKWLDDAPDDQDARILAARTARREGAYARSIEHLDAYQRRNGSRAEIVFEDTLRRIQLGEVDEARPLFPPDETANETPNLDLIVEAYLTGLTMILDRLPSESGILPEKKPFFTRGLWAADKWLQLRSSPADRAQGFLWRGRMLQALSKHAESEANARTAVECNPENLDARTFLALTISQEAPKEAIEQLRFVLSRRPDDAKIQAMLASGLRGIGQTEEARKLLDRALELEPGNVNYIIERGNLAIDELQTETAKRLLSRAEVLSPNNTEVLNALRRLMFLVGDKESGRKYLERFEALTKKKVDHPPGSQK